MAAKMGCVQLRRVARPLEVMDPPMKKFVICATPRIARMIIVSGCLILNPSARPVRSLRAVAAMTAAARMAPAEKRTKLIRQGSTLAEMSFTKSELVPKSAQAPMMESAPRRGRASRCESAMERIIARNPPGRPSPRNEEYKVDSIPEKPQPQ